MVEVRRSTVIDAPIAQVWAVLRDFNGHDQWHPAVSRSAVEDGLPSDMVGAVRDFRLADGSRIREQLLSLSDQEHCFQYCILEAPMPLIGYVARVSLQPVTDGDRTYWEWRSRFSPPPSRERELAALVGEQIYEAGFRAVRELVAAGRAAPVRAAPPAPLQPAGAGETQAIVMERHGGPEVLRVRTIPVSRPGPGEVLIRQRAIGVNYIDVYTRTGYFNLVRPPGVPGMEGCGVIEAVGPDVRDWRAGERVAYACAPPGSYAARRVMKTDLLVRPPEFLDDASVAASLLKGITAGFLLHDVHAVQPGDTVLIHAAAGGVGLLVTQWAKALGATVIGTASSAEKIARARQAGADHVINYREKDFADEVLALTAGRGADVVYDAVGKDTFANSVKALKVRGTLVSFGQASGDIGAYDIGGLAAKSITLSRPNYGHFTDTHEAVTFQAERFFRAVRDGLVTVDSPVRFPLAEAAAAHALLEDRALTGSVVLTA